MDGHKPDTTDTQFLKVIQLGNYTLQIADSISVRIAERIDENFVKGTIVVIGTFAQRTGLGNHCLNLIERNAALALSIQSRPRGILGGGGFGIVTS